VLLKDFGTRTQLSDLATNLKERKLTMSTDTNSIHLFAKGYMNNFIEPVVKMVGELDEPTSPTMLCDVVPRYEIPAIRGLVVVMPAARNVQGNGSTVDDIEKVTQEYGIAHLVIRGRRDMRTVYYKHNFLFDFPRTLDVLSQPENPTSLDNVEIFKNFLDQQQHSTIVTSVAWERFIEVMEYLRDAKVESPEGIDVLSWGELEHRVSRKRGGT